MLAKVSHQPRADLTSYSSVRDPSTRNTRLICTVYDWLGVDEMAHVRLHGGNNPTCASTETVLRVHTVSSTRAVSTGRYYYFRPGRTGKVKTKRTTVWLKGRGERVAGQGCAPWPESMSLSLENRSSSGSLLQV